MKWMEKRMSGLRDIVLALGPMVALIGLWLALQLWILPRFGVNT